MRTVAEWIGKNDDQAVPARVQDRVANKTCDCCAICTKPAKPGQVDHVIPLILGGQHRESNLQWICKPCHAAKTALEVKLKAKVARVRKRNLGIRRPKQTIKSRGFERASPQRTASKPINRHAEG